ncbi:hypothetical protein TNCV_3546661 [Trichonephila clavipes]|nr:hypothetical protein TNCV_3546661 [Trichonephila clavipes]
MDSLGHSSLPPSALGRQDDEEATPGYSKKVRKSLAGVGGRWRYVNQSTEGSVRWSARSPRLTYLNYFLWGYVQSQVDETPVNPVEDLVASIVAAVGLGHHSLPPIDLGRVEEEMVSPGGRPMQVIRKRFVEDR